MVHFSDHLYWKESARTSVKGITRTYWRCIFWKRGSDGEVGFKCPGRAVSFSDGIQITAEHNHNGEKARVELKRMQGSLQKQAMESREAPRAIIGKAIQKVAEEARPLIRRSLMGRAIRRRRHEEKLEPANPKNLKELVIPKEFQMRNDELFLKYDGWNGDERILLFSTDKCLDLLSSIPNWGCDGTFDVVPLLFDQLWILYEFLDTESMSRLKCGLEDSKWTYTRDPLQQNGMIVASSLVSMLNACLEEALSTSISSI
uniref:FLYWCH-type domain-containing protein n=1 Tax=Ditylenchus dipsaci TaxID=166011 RepID=A0A915EL79_9BILA